MKDPNRTSPLHEDAVHESAWKHVTGRAQFINDMDMPPHGLVSYIVTSPVAHGRIRSIDTEAARNMPGIAAVITAKDIPGVNDVSAVSAGDEEILASEEVFCVGQAIALVVGETYEACIAAGKKVVVDIEPLEAILDVRDAIAKGSLFEDHHIIERGDLEAAYKQADFILEGEVESPGQEHWYLETQVAQAEVNEDDDILIYASSQNPRECQAKSPKCSITPKVASSSSCREWVADSAAKKLKAPNTHAWPLSAHTSPAAPSASGSIAIKI